MAYDLGTAHGKIEVTYDSDGAPQRAKRDVEEVGKSSKKSDKDLKKFGDTLKKLGGFAAKGAGIAALVVSLTNAGAAAGAAAIQILGIVPALASIASLAAALPGAFIALHATIGILKAAFVGMSDIFKEAFTTESADKFNEALKKLTPAAQAFAKSFKSDLVPQLRTLQQSIQEAFFSNNLQSLFPAVASAAQRLGGNLTEVSRQFGSIVKSTAQFALGSKSIGFVNDSLLMFRTALANIAPAIKPVLNGLIDVGSVGLALLGRLSAAVGGVGQKFGAWLSEIAASGQLQEWIDQAITTLGQLGDIIGNVASILTSLFTAAQATGGGLLGTLQELTGQAAAFLRSAEGAGAVRELFAGILAVAGQLAPVITTLVGVLARALGPALARIATEVGPVLLNVVNALAPAFGPLANAIASLLAAVAPLLPPIAALAALLVGSLANGISGLASMLGPTISLLGGAFLAAFEQLAPVVEAIATQALPLMAAAGVEIAKAFLPLAPAIVQVATAIASALLPYLPQLAANFQKIMPAVVQLATVLGGQLADALIAIVPYIPAIVGAFVGFSSAMATVTGIGIKLVAFVLSLGTSFLSLATGALSAFTTFRTAVANGITGAYNAIVSTGASIIAWFVALPGRVGSALVALPGQIVNIVKNAVTSMAFAFGAGIGTLVTLAVQAPGKIGAAFSSLLSTIRSVAVNAWNAVRAAFNSGVAAVVGLARAAPGRISGALASLPGLLRSAAVSAFNSFKSAVSTGINNAVSLARTIGSKIKSAVGNLGSALVGAGRDAVMGLVNGLRGAIGAAVSAAAAVGKSVINGIKSTLKIGSPSKVTFEQGGWTGEGLELGLLDKLKAVKAAAQQLAKTVIAPSVGFRTDTTGIVARRAMAGQDWSPSTAASGPGLTQNVYALPGMSAREVAKYSASKLNLMARTGTSAVAVAPPPNQEA